MRMKHISAPSAVPKRVAATAMIAVAFRPSQSSR